MSEYERGRAEERARIAWWLRAACDGPASVNTSPEVLAALSDLADVVEHHPERFAQAPVTSDGRRRGEGRRATVDERFAFERAWDARFKAGQAAVPKPPPG